MRNNYKGTGSQYEVDWVLCPYCRHKLFKRLIGADALIEIKCSSCKHVFELSLDGNKPEALE